MDFMHVFQKSPIILQKQYNNMKGNEPITNCKHFNIQSFNQSINQCYKKSVSYYRARHRGL